MRCTLLKHLTSWFCLKLLWRGQARDTDKLVAGARRAIDINWSPRSKPTFGHIFERHGAGSKITDKLRGRAAGTQQEQGQWTDNNKAAEFLKSIHGQLNGSITIEIPEGLGQVIMPDGSVVPTTWAKIVPQPGGVYKTAYPVLKP